MIQLIVYGDPAPKGSKSFRGMSRKGHAIMSESSKTLPAWSDAVAWQARAYLQRAAVEASGGVGQASAMMITGPVRLQAVFTVRKPKSAPKTTVTYPDRKPDIDKLMRAVMDALTTSGLWEDDARVVEAAGAKRYPREGVGALDSPGCIIKVWRLSEL